MPGLRPVPKPPCPPDVMTIGDLSLYLQVSKSSLYKLAQEGKVPEQKVGRHWRFHRGVIDRWLGSDHADSKFVKEKQYGALAV